MSMAHRSRWVHLAMVVSLAVLAATLCWLPVQADAKPQPKPQLSIAVDNGHDTAAPKEKLGYTITVSNLGSTKVRHLLISQTIPAHTKLISVSKQGKTRSGTVTWDVDLAAGEKKALHTDFVVGSALPDQLLRLATVTCARTSQKAAPIVCASDSDQLPAGAAAEKKQHQLEQQAMSGKSSWLLPALVGLGIVVLAAAGVLVVALRRRTRLLQSGSANTPPGVTENNSDAETTRR